MYCFPCFSSQRSKKSMNNDGANNDKVINQSTPSEPTRQRLNIENNGDTNHIENLNTSTVKTFTFRELATATKIFRQECLLGEGGFGRVYKGTLQSTGQVVAVKQLDKHGLHAIKEFQAEVSALSQLDHTNLVKLIGYCTDGDQRLLVYDFVSGGSLQDRLLDMKPDKQPMDWTTRMKVAYGVAQGLEYLHDKVNPPVIYRDLKTSNILLDNELSPKLSDFGLHKLGPSTGDKMALASTVMGTYGHSAPEYARGGNPTIKSDVYSFGVVLLELITGRRAVDTTKPSDEQNLVAWAQTIFRDPKRYPDMADPRLKKKFPEKGLNQAVAIASMCLQEEATARPLISDVTVALSFLSISTEDGIPTAVPILSFRDKSMSIALSRHTSYSATPSEREDKQTSNSLDEQHYVKLEEMQGDNKYNDEDEGSAMDSNGSSDYGSKSDKEDQEEEDEEEGEEEEGSESYIGKSGKSNFNSSYGSERGSIDNRIAASSLKSHRSDSSEEEIGNLSHKDSRKSDEESTSSRGDSGRDDSLRITSCRTSSHTLKDDEDTRGECNHRSSNSDDQSESLDDSDDDGSSHSKKLEGQFASSGLRPTNLIGLGQSGDFL